MLNKTYLYVVLSRSNTTAFCTHVILCYNSSIIMMSKIGAVAAAVVVIEYLPQMIDLSDDVGPLPTNDYVRHFVLRTRYIREQVNAILCSQSGRKKCCGARLPFSTTFCDRSFFSKVARQQQQYTGVPAA